MNWEGQSLILRHSIREKILDAKYSLHQQLTEEGKTLAKVFGANLSKYSRKFKIFYSPYLRCVQTAEFISDGIDQEKITELIVNEKMGCYFYRDWDFCAKLMNEGVFRSEWEKGNISTSCILPIEKTSEEILAEIKFMSSKYQNCLNIFITHDFNIYSLKFRLFKNEHQRAMPGFLEGLKFTAGVKNFENFTLDKLIII